MLELSDGVRGVSCHKVDIISFVTVLTDGVSDISRLSGVYPVSCHHLYLF